MTIPASRADGPASAGQLRYLRDLAGSHAMFGLTVDKTETLTRVEQQIVDGLSASEASALIRQAYLAKPHPTEKSPLPLSAVGGIDGLAVSEGCYAVLLDDTLRFYRIYTAPTGEFTGQVVMRRYASENLLALYPDEARVALRLIDADPDAAAFRFADEHTRCHICTRVLTDAVSRLLSVGPNCRGFTTHRGLRDAAGEVDREPARRYAYRALRLWALERGFVDPRSKHERQALAGQMTASRLAAAWSGLPGLLALPAEEAVVLVRQALDGTLAEALHSMLVDAPPDTALDLLASGVLSPAVLNVLATHRAARVRAAAGDYLLSVLTG